MTTKDNENEDKPAGSSQEDRIKEITKEEREDASSYYASGESEEPDTTEEDLNKPVPAPDAEGEEMSLIKAVAYLGFGMAAIAIVFILFFLRDLDDRVINVDTALDKLDEKFIPFKDNVEKSLSRVTGDVEQLRGKFQMYERMVAVMELKRALVSIQEVTEGASPEVKAKAGEVIASIQTLLTQLGEEPSEGLPTAGVPAAAGAEITAPSPEPAAEEAAPEPSEETPVGQIELEESGESSETMAEAESSEVSEDEEEADEGGDEEEDEEDEEEEEEE